MEMTLRGGMTVEPDKIKPFMMWMSPSPIQGVWLDLDRRYGSKKKKKWKINTKNSGLPKFAPLVARTSLGPKDKISVVAEDIVEKEQNQMAINEDRVARLGYSQTFLLIKEIQKTNCAFVFYQSC